MPPEPLAFAFVLLHRVRAIRAFLLARAEQYDRLAILADLLLDILIRRIDLHPFGTPTEEAIRCRIALAYKVDPERIGERRRDFHHLYGKAEALAGFLDLFKCVVNE